MYPSAKPGSSAGATFARQGTALCWLLVAVILLANLPLVLAQTSATGALTGSVADPSGAMIAEARITTTNEATGEVRAVNSQANGTYAFPLLPPGSYRVEASKSGFKVKVLEGVHINVTETETLKIQLDLGALSEKVVVEGEAEQLQTETSALGRVTDERAIETLPLVTRSFTQIMSLVPGISTEVTNAGALGYGGIGTLSAPVVVHGTHTAQNNFQLNGVEINDTQGSGAGGGTGSSGGFAIPNPDAIEEFKVQTGLYDASFGNAGASVNVVTKSGSNTFHGSVFEFFRNNVLNANSFFSNSAGRPRPILRQNQFGFALGGPVKRDKLLFFTSYQGTRQLNGVVSGCASSILTPPLTNDRSAAALGALFGGKAGANGGVAVAPDGSNINPVALKLLNLKLSGGNFLIPTPQVINPNGSFATQGFSVFSNPCTFNEDQFVTNADFLHTAKSKFSGKFFFANSTQVLTLPPFNPAVPGSPQNAVSGFRNLAVTHTYIFNPNLFNQAEFGFHRINFSAVQTDAFKFSDVGISVPYLDTLPSIQIAGGLNLGGNAQTGTFDQETFIFQDSISYVHGKQIVQVGGGINRLHDDSVYLAGAQVAFQSFPDFLLGLSAAGNGSSFSNVFESFALEGDLGRLWRVWNGNLYVQDDVKVTRRLTLNLGFRYERLGGFSDPRGRNGNFYTSLANPNPPVSGTLAGYVIPSNFRGSVPQGITKLDSDLGINGDGENTWAPRIGWAWRLPHTERLVLRGGYGIYYGQITGQPLLGLTNDPPFSSQIDLIGPANAAATFANPLPPALIFPIFPPYSPTTVLTPVLVSAAYRPPVVQQYSLNLQTDLGHELTLQVGYFGTRGSKLLRTRWINQALLATPSNPIRGVTTNTLSNIAQRVPLQGFGTGTTQHENGSGSWYNALEVSLAKRFSNGLQFLAAYTFARDLTTDFSNGTQSAGGQVIGNQNSANPSYGPDNFVREQRFVLSYLYALPGPKNKNSFPGRVLGGWEASGVTTVQSGHRLTLQFTNGSNVEGIFFDRAQLAPGCTHNQLVTPGSLESKLGNYFNKSCFTKPPVVGDDGKATGFGNAGAGIVTGPGQANIDFAILKRTSLRWPSDIANLEFRTEFFNAFNHSQFADPGINSSSSAFGKITSTVVSPRIIQFALKLNF
jgi:hypothetical protein